MVKKHKSEKERFIKNVLILGAIILFFGWKAVGYTHFSDVSDTNTITKAMVVNQKRLFPKNYDEIQRKSVQMNGKEVILTRYVRRDGRNNALGGEHFSIVYDKKGMLKGFIFKDLSLTGKKLPSKEEAHKKALAFIKTYAPELLINYKFNGISHEIEPLKVISTTGINHIISINYLRVKMRNNNSGLWFWVFVGNDGQIIGFERDLDWSYLYFQRSTEQWLFDEWRISHGFL